MRSRPTLATLAVIAIFASACSAQTAATPGSVVTPAPTDAPSQTQEPTEAPTEVPTQAPTEAPTEAPAGDELEYQLPPNFGSEDLTSGFTPDPFSAEMTSGGPIDASYLGGDCRGFATAAPDFDVTYTAGDLSLLRFYFVADEADDTTLIINAPDGSWHCNDDAPGTIDPQFDFQDPASGLYDVWIGSFESGATISGTLYVTELESNGP